MKLTDLIGKTITKIQREEDDTVTISFIDDTTVCLEAISRNYDPVVIIPQKKFVQITKIEAVYEEITE